MADEYTPTSWVDGVPPYIDAEHLNKIEAELVRLGTQLAAIKAAYLGKSAISNVQVNDQNKVPSSALVYGMNEDISVLNSNLNGLTFYKSLSEIGITGTDFTYQDFVNGMETNSILMLRINGVSFMPTTNYYTLIVYKLNISNTNRIIFEAIEDTGSIDGIWRARYASTASTQWTGWKKLAFT